MGSCKEVANLMVKCSLTNSISHNFNTSFSFLTFSSFWQTKTYVGDLKILLHGIFFKIRFEIYCCSINLGFGNILIQISTFKYRNSVWKITNLKKISIGVHDAFNKLVFFLHSALCTQIEAIIWMMLFFSCRLT